MSTWLVTTAAPLALFGVGLALTEGTRSESVLPGTQIVAASQIADGAPGCAVAPAQSGAPAGSSPVKGPAEAVADSKAGNGSCENNQSPDQSQPSQNAGSQVPTAQAPTAFAPGIPLAPFLAVPAGAAGLAVATAKSAG